MTISEQRGGCRRALQKRSLGAFAAPLRLIVSGEPAGEIFELHVSGGVASKETQSFLVGDSFKHDAVDSEHGDAQNRDRCR